MNKTLNNIIVNSEDGSNTIYVPSLDEHYHSTHGAVQESKHVFIRPGINYLSKQELNIFEVGFGTGLNALLTAIESNKSKKRVFYTTIEKYPVSREVIGRLNYPEILDDNDDLFLKIHDCEWEREVGITDLFTLHKIESDIGDYNFIKHFDIIYFDAFAPDKQPGMWTDEIIEKIGSACNTGSLFLTYSAKGQLKRQLIKAGFVPEHLPGPPGKREITRAVKK